MSTTALRRVRTPDLMLQSWRWENRGWQSKTRTWFEKHTTSKYQTLLSKRVSTLWLARNTVPPEWRDEADVATLLPGLRGPKLRDFRKSQSGYTEQSCETSKVVTIVISIEVKGEASLRLIWISSGVLYTSTGGKGKRYFTLRSGQHLRVRVREDDELLGVGLALLRLHTATHHHVALAVQGDELRPRLHLAVLGLQDDLVDAGVHSDDAVIPGERLGRQPRCGLGGCQVYTCAWPRG